MSLDPARALRPASIASEPGRSRRKVPVLIGGLMLFAGTAAFGSWMIVASHQQYPGQAEAWVGTVFGVFLILLGVLVVLVAVSVLRQIHRLSGRTQALIVVDETGVTDAVGDLWTWDATAGRTGSAEDPRRSGGRRKTETTKARPPRRAGRVYVLPRAGPDQSR